LNALTAYSYSRNPAMTQRYTDSRNKILNEYKDLHVNLAKYPEQMAQLDKTERLEMRALKLCDGLKDTFDKEDIDIVGLMQIKGLRSQMEALMEETIAELRRLNDVVQEQSGVKSDAALAWRRNAKILLWSAVAANIVVSVVLGLLFSRAITDRLIVLTT